MLPRRIAMLSVHTCPLVTLGGKKTGGMNVYVRDLAGELVRRGIQVDVFTRYQGVCDLGRAHQIGDRGRVIHIPAGPPSSLPTISHLELLPQFTQGVLEFVAQEGIHYDLLHSHYWLSGLVAHDLQRAWNSSRYVPIVQMFHTLGLMKNRVALHEKDREPTLRIEREREVMEKVDRIVAATPAEEAQLHWLYGVDASKVVTVPPGVDLERFHPIDRQEARYRVDVPAENQMILFVGRIEPLKGIDTLMRAIAILRAGCPADTPCLYLAIIGGEPDDQARENAEMERLQQMRVDLGIENEVTFLGAKDQDALQYYYSAADAVVMPSHYESFGMVALEAMACGTPVIASEVGGLAFLVQDGKTGFHVQDQDAQALAGKLSLILDDPELREKLGRQAAAYAQGFAWSRIADQLLSVFSEVTPSADNAVNRLSPVPL
jgi:D-inositol-3-phosphate glycosyltransferase